MQGNVFWGRVGLCLYGAVLSSISCLAWAQELTPDQEYQQLIKVNQDIQPLGANPFGENISPYNGELSFDITDVSLAGNGPALVVARSLSTASPLGYGLNAERPFGDWDLNIPRIETATAHQTNVMGWQTGSGTSSIVYERCTYFLPPPNVTAAQNGGDPWSSDEWWYGYHLIVPGQGSQDLLARSVGNTLAPSAGVRAYPIVTKNNWMIGCGVTADDGGEGFLAVAPDGTQYTFAHMVYRPMAFATTPLGTVPGLAEGEPGRAKPMAADANILARRDAFLYVTKITDRFGNSLTYSYDNAHGNLTRITASDGRSVSIDYDSTGYLIHSITANASNAPSRSWTYAYDTGNAALPRLTGVTLPDRSAWSYNLGAFQTDVPNTLGGSCGTNRIPTLVTDNPAIGTITHPSGLTGTFTLKPMMHGRSYVPKYCWGPTGSVTLNYYTYPEYYFQPTIISKTFGGAGILAQTWAYGYSNANQSYGGDACYSNGSCPATIYTDVTDPSGNDVRYTYSNRWGATEGQLLSTTYYAGAAGGAVLRTETNTYADSTGGPWPAQYGGDLQRRDNAQQTEQLAPVQRRVVTEDGDIYTWQAIAFNAYAQPTDVKRYSSIAGQQAIEESTTYFNDPSLWVLGLPLTVTNIATGEVESSNTYTDRDLLQTRSRFGQLLMTYTYNGAGQLASFIDGNDYATNLSNYYRGVPQSIAYEDGTHQSLVVDDFGQIRSITDQAGSTTSYDYDAIGRIAAITYPANDEIGWYSQRFTYDFVGNERGIAGNHWRRTVWQGDRADVTYFDATLRPILGSKYRSSDGALAITTQTNYDWKGNPVFQSYPVSGLPNFNTVSAGTTTAYDALGRVIQTQQSSELGPLTTRTDYLSGASRRVTDPKGNATTTSYQVFDQPSYEAPIHVAAPEGVTQAITRDLYGNPTVITQSSQAQSPLAQSQGLVIGGPIMKASGSDRATRNFFYDTYHRLCRTSEFESADTVIAYDDGNNIDWTADGLAVTGSGCGQEQVADAVKTFHTYDTMNRLTVLEPPEGTQGTTYQYDAVGNLTHAHSGIAHWSGTYNKRNMPMSESLTANGFSNTLHYAHDSYGNLSATLYPDGTNVTYAPDIFGRPTQTGSFASDISYFPDGEVAHIILGNGADYVTEQNARQQLSHYSYIKGSAFSVSEDLAYDPNGNITHFTDLVNGQRSKALSYDGLNRLTQAQAGALWGTESFTYDALNNLTDRTLQGESITYGYDLLNRLTRIAYGGGNTTTLGYDTRGNVTNKNGNTLVFDGKSQLVDVPGFASYAYDADGRRVLKQVANDGPSTYYFYTHSGQLLYQYDEDMAKGTSYVYLGRKLIVRNDEYESAIVGHIDGVLIDSNDNAVINGWACSTGLTQSIQVQTYLGGPTGKGALMGTYGANQASEPAVAAECGVSSGSFRFSIPLSATMRSDHVDEKIYIYGISPVGNANEELGNSGEFTVPAEQKAPSAPTVTATKTGDGMGIAINWSTVNGATGHVLEEQFNEGHWTEVYTGNATTYTINPAANGNYIFRVHSCNSYGCGDWGESGDVHLANVPSTPSAIHVPGASFNPVSVSWGSSTNATSYNVEQSINGGGWAVAYDGTTTSANVSVSMSGSYVYRVKACNTYGCSGYATSSAVAVTVPPAYAPSLNVPGTSSNGSYAVSWSGVNDTNRYTLQEQINGGGWNTVQDNGATSWGTAGRGNGTYGYRVVACNNAGCGPWSGTASVSVVLPPVLPANPLTLSITGPSSKPVMHAAWGPAAGANDYVLRVELRKINGGSTTNDYRVTDTTWSSLYLNPGGATLYVQLQACNGSGCSAWSAPQHITLPAG